MVMRKLVLKIFACGVHFPPILDFSFDNLGDIMPPPTLVFKTKEDFCKHIKQINQISLHLIIKNKLCSY